MKIGSIFRIVYSKVIFNVIFTRCMLSRDRKLVSPYCHIHPHVIFQIFYHVYTFIWKLFSFCKKKKKIIIITTDCCKMKWKWWRNKYSNQGFFSLFFHVEDKTKYFEKAFIWLMYKLHVDRLCPSGSKSCYSYQVVSHQIYCSLCPIEKRIWSNKENLSYIYWLLQHLSCFTVTAQLTPNVSVYLQYIRVPFVFGEVDRHSNCFFLFILGHFIH